MKSEYSNKLQTMIRKFNALDGHDRTQFISIILRLSEIESENYAQAIAKAEEK